MTIDVLPGVIPTPTRAAIKAKHQKDFLFRAPLGTDVTPGSDEDAWSSVAADTVLPLYAAAKTAGDNLALSQMAGKALDAYGTPRGVRRNPAFGASGEVAIVTSVGGGDLLEGDTLVDPVSGRRYAVSAPGHYTTATSVAIRALDTGVATNAPAGTQLTFVTPRPGIGAGAIVIAQPDGSGLSGGSAEEDDESYRARITDRAENPPADGNVAAILAATEATPGIGMQRAFVYPAILGPGTYGVTFTVNPTTTTGSRVPTGTQLAAATAYLQSVIPADDGIFPCSLISQPVDVVLRVAWRDPASGWADGDLAWPDHFASGGAIVASAVASALSFTLSRTGGYVGVRQPQIGQTIAFYDPTTGAFSRKRIATITGTGPWAITCDASNGASDTTTPAVGAAAMPFSVSLTTILDPLRAYFATLGPGEQVATFFDPGGRQRRQPESPGDAPSVLSSHLIDGISALANVFDVALLAPAVPLTTTVGHPGIDASLTELRELAVYAKEG